MQLITGNTYPVRAELKALGGIWDPTAKGWRVPDDKAAEAAAIVDRAGPVAPKSHRGRDSRGRSGIVVTRFSSGAEVYRNARGRCIDAPCCGCCS